MRQNWWIADSPTELAFTRLDVPADVAYVREFGAYSVASESVGGGAEFDVPPYREVVDGDDISVTLRSVSVSGEVADVRVTIEVGTGPAIFDSGWDSDTSFGLRLFEVAGADEWRLDRVPWPFEVCR